jgi:hypothetical protein
VDYGYYPALVIGLVGSSVIHLSQGLLKLAIDRRQTGDRSVGNRYLYGLGLTLNFSAPFWVIAANRFGPTVFYTSMYASGLLGLILFSRWKLHRPFQFMEVLGASLLILGSFILVLGFGRADVADMETTQPGWLIGVFVFFGLLIWPAVRLSEKVHWLSTGLIMGALGGAFLALDSLLKGVAQADGGVSGFLPVTGHGWTLFIASFVGAAAALGMTQWAHSKHQPPTATIAAYDAGYVALPVLLLPVAQGRSGQLDPICIAGLFVLLLGLYCIGRANRNTSAASAS